MRRLEALGTNTPVCSCGESHWACFDEHHTGGRRFDKGSVVLVCANCHRKLTVEQKDHPNFGSADPDPFTRLLQRLVRMAMGAAAILRLIAKQLTAVARELTRELEAKTTAAAAQTGDSR